MSIQPALDGHYRVSPETLSFYRQNGFCRLKEVLSRPEVEFYRDAIDAAVNERSGHDQRPMTDKNFYERAFTQCGHLWSDFPLVSKFTTSPRLAGIASQLLDKKKVRLWHDQALYKLPGGGVTEPHQDMAYWPMLDREAGTIWVALSDATISMGAMYFIPESHKMAIDSWDNTIQEDSNLVKRLPEQVQEQAVGYDLNPGDATFHHGLTIHYTGENKTQQIRKAMCVIYFPDGVRFDGTSPASQHHCAAGTPHGHPIATAKNPILT